MRHAVIMAGGSGTRLWPLSRKSRPKQLLRIFDGQSLLRRPCTNRLAAFLPPQQIYVITGKDYLPAIATELPDVPLHNLFGEPSARDTANAVGLAAHLLARKDATGTMGVFTADHIIRPVDEFVQTIKKGFEAAERYKDALVTFGVKPRSPHTGYGYVQFGNKLDADVYEIREFKEKPDLATAERYVASGEYYWNSGMFVWRIPTILKQLEQHHPDSHRRLEQVASQWNEADQSDATAELFSSLPKISVDFAIMEKAVKVAGVEMTCDWLDVGSWNSLAEIFRPDAKGNTLAAPHVLALDSANNIIVSESNHVIAAIGVQDLVIVHAADATLICRREDTQRIKDLLANADQTLL